MTSRLFDKIWRMPDMSKWKVLLVCGILSLMIGAKILVMGHPVQEGVGEIATLWMMASLVLWFLGEMEDEPINH
jgi:hypothetical protein